MGEPEALLGSLVDGRYRLDKVLGEGGFGAVYVATRQDGTRVALKVLAEEALARVGGDDRFRREAELAKRLSHPNVVEVLDEGIDAQGTRFIAFELLEGRSLGDEIGRWGAIQPRRAIHITMGVLDALEAAHAIGIIHRDLKPANIMLLDGSDRLKVLDFGIAKSINKNTIAGLTQAGQVLGTPAYMAVEQLTGDPVTPATDIFALGVVLIEMIIGKPPYPVGSTAMDIVRSRLTGIELELPPDLLRHPLGAIALKATKPHPLERYQSVAEMRVDLQQALQTPTLQQTLDSPYAGSPVAPTALPPTGAAHAMSTAAHTSAPVVMQAGFTQPGPQPAALAPVRQPGTSAGAIAGVAIAVGAILVAGVGVGLWVSASSATEVASADDDAEDDDAPDDDDAPRKKKKKRKKKSVAPEPTRAEGLAPPDPIPQIPAPPPPPEPTTHASRVMTCRGAATQNKVTLRSHVAAIGWRVTGNLTYCAGNMVNFRCQGGTGRGVTAENGALKGSTAVVRFRSRADAAAFASKQRGQTSRDPVTYAEDGAAVLYIQMPDAEADKLMARFCR